MNATIHQVSSGVFNPENYIYVGCDDLEQVIGKCAHCGQRVRYIAKLQHIQTKETIFVGETCVDSRFGVSHEEFETLRKQGRLNSAQKSLNERKAAFITEFPIVQELLNRRNDHYILGDLANRFERTATLSTKQLKLVAKLFVQVDEHNARLSEREVVEAELIAKGVRIPTGRNQVTGTVLSTKFEDTEWGYSAKMLVQDDAGWKVWCSIPEFRDLQNGQRVTFSVDITPKSELFGFGKRPTKFKLWFEDKQEWCAE